MTPNRSVSTRHTGSVFVTRMDGFSPRESRCFPGAPIVRRAGEAAPRGGAPRAAHTGNALCVVWERAAYPATVSSARRHTTSRVHTAPALSVAMTAGSRGSRTWYFFMEMTSSVNEWG